MAKYTRKRNVRNFHNAVKPAKMQKEATGLFPSLERLIQTKRKKRKNSMRVRACVCECFQQCID